MTHGSGGSFFTYTPGSTGHNWEDQRGPLPERASLPPGQPGGGTWRAWRGAPGQAGAGRGRGQAVTCRGPLRLRGGPGSVWRAATPAGMGLAPARSRGTWPARRLFPAAPPGGALAQAPEGPGRAQLEGGAEPRPSRPAASPPPPPPSPPEARRLDRARSPSGRSRSGSPPGHALEAAVRAVAPPLEPEPPAPDGPRPPFGAQRVRRLHRTH
ncbi:uncharacterized protein LOC141522870 [Macrotis lagotis]|uniref:uncharacterized protein LOC141522870 n=1 Tax=Macrotis lagotis TaxID=92651 RepID=UPI003D69286D